MKKFLIILIIVLLVVPAAIWFLMKNGEQPSQQQSSIAVKSAGVSTSDVSGSTPSVTATGTTQQPARGTEIVRTLAQLQEAKLDTDFFNESVFKRLVDFSVSLPEASVGRENPFAPIRIIIGSATTTVVAL